ncbi:hypothetical protein E2C01_033327 [Portunus trituberculatus]|uniref:Uncharacterized protein n=1 Tax=Portunus trituberculatus TaxID=210409 RepID=A0A5B7F3R5_PORTR|nr:hypothetical protein [Portunus trituberculatus]
MFSLLYKFTVILIRVFKRRELCAKDIRPFPTQSPLRFSPQSLLTLALPFTNAMRFSLITRVTTRNGSLPMGDGIAFDKQFISEFSRAGVTGAETCVGGFSLK